MIGRRAQRVQAGRLGVAALRGIAELKSAGAWNKYFEQRRDQVGAILDAAPAASFSSLMRCFTTLSREMEKAAAARPSPTNTRGIPIVNQEFAARVQRFQLDARKSGRTLTYAEAAELAHIEEDLARPTAQRFSEQIGSLNRIPSDPISVRRDRAAKRVLVEAGHRGQVLTYSEALSIASEQDRLARGQARFAEDVVEPEKAGSIAKSALLEYFRKLFDGEDEKVLTLDDITAAEVAVDEALDQEFGVGAASVIGAAVLEALHDVLYHLIFRGKDRHGAAAAVRWESVESICDQASAAVRGAVTAKLAEIR